MTGKISGRSDIFDRDSDSELAVIEVWRIFVAGDTPRSFARVEPALTGAAGLT
ncbi:MAG TPA: hypothetical protein VGG43_14125 [Acidimicrobiales bacterium]|jgi:hypothetical protein